MIKSCLFDTVMFENILSNSQGKKGAAGKDGKKGKTGQQGPAGPPGTAAGVAPKPAALSRPRGPAGDVSIQCTVFIYCLYYALYILYCFLQEETYKNKKAVLRSLVELYIQWSKLLGKTKTCL